MTVRTRWIALPCVLAVTLGFAGSASAHGEGSYLDGALRKLGRGMANVFTCPAELLRTPTLVGREEGSVAATTVGLVQGAWRTVLRGTVGVFEIATFYLEVPKGFRPLMSPEFVYVNGDWVE